MKTTIPTKNPSCVSRPFWLVMSRQGDSYAKYDIGQGVRVYPLAANTYSGAMDEAKRILDYHGENGHWADYEGSPVEAFIIEAAQIVDLDGDAARRLVQQQSKSAKAAALDAQIAELQKQRNTL